MDGYEKPATTLELLDRLVPLGFPDSAFCVLHHFKEPTTIAAHRRYCEGLVEEGATFRLNTNRLVQRRLELVLRMCEAGPLIKPTPTQFEHLAHVALIEFPHDLRPKMEQFLESESRSKGAA